jgi:hypothetical protein
LVQKWYTAPACYTEEHAHFSSRAAPALRAILAYAAFHQLRQGVRGFDLSQALVLAILLLFEALLFVVAWFSSSMYWPVAVVFTVPFIVLTGAIILRLADRI